LREKNLSSYKEKALGAFESALNILYSLNSYDFKAYCKVNNAIGELYLGSNHFLVAENYFSNAIMKTKDFSGEEKQLAFTPMLNLGKTYNKLKNYNEALPYLMQCEHIV
jgi:tetratricopeptide (TPR) repeat protein